MMSTRRQVHIAVAHRHDDDDGCRLCHSRHPRGSSSRKVSLVRASSSGEDDATAASSWNGYGRLRPPSHCISEPRTAGSAGVGGAARGHSIRRSDPPSITHPNIQAAFTHPHAFSSPHTFVFSADVHPSTSPRTHHHRSASLAPAQILAHAFGPPAKGYEFSVSDVGEEGWMGSGIDGELRDEEVMDGAPTVEAWPDCSSSVGSLSDGWQAESVCRKRRRRDQTTIHSEVMNSFSLEDLSTTPSSSSSSSTASPSTSIRSLDLQKDNYFLPIGSPPSISASPWSSSSHLTSSYSSSPLDAEMTPKASHLRRWSSAERHFPPSPPPPSSSPADLSSPPPFLHYQPSAESFVLSSNPNDTSPNESPFTLTITSSSSTAPTLTRTPSKKRKRRTYEWRFRSSFHPLLRSEMPAPVAAIVPPRPLSNKQQKVSPRTHSHLVPTFRVGLKHVGLAPQTIRPSPATQTPLAISELDAFGAGPARALLAFEGTRYRPPPLDMKGWRRSSHAPLSSKERRLLKLLEEHKELEPRDFTERKERMWQRRQEERRELDEAEAEDVEMSEIQLSFDVEMGEL